MAVKSTLPSAFLYLVDGRLLGAACVGRHELFDADLDNTHETADDRAYRHHAAAAICQSCPVLNACATVAAEAGRHAEGVWAGRIPSPRPLGRPRRKAS